MRDVKQRTSRSAGTGAVIQRASAEDMMQLAADVGPVPAQIGAVLMLDPAAEFNVSAATRLIAQRIRAVPRFRHVLVNAPPGCGRPYWVDDPNFAIGHHVRSVACSPPGDEAALLDAAATIVTEPLPRSRPLWRATFVTGLAESRIALVVAFHHVLADGVGGLAVFANLVDGAAAATEAPLPRPTPSIRELAADAWRARLRALARLPAMLPTARHAVTELHPAAASRAGRTTLNAPTGRRRRLGVARTELAPVRDLARAHEATVNDVVLTAIAGALAALLARRGETVDHLVVSVPVSRRTSATSAELGNRVGMMPVKLPVRGDRIERLRRVTRITRAQKTTTRGASAALLWPAFRLLAAVGLLRWFINRQRTVHTFETNLRGPDRRLTFAGHPLTDVLPLAIITGNVTTSFAVLSYAGTLTVVVIADPERLPDLDALTRSLQDELDWMAAERTAGPGRTTTARHQARQHH